MEKVLVNIQVPAIGDSFDAFVPLDIPVAELAPIIASGVSDLSGGKYCVSSYEMLCLRGTAALLNPEYTLQDYSVQDGAHLYLI